MKRSLFKFLLLTFGVTWICWTASFVISYGPAILRRADAARAPAATTPLATALLAGAVLLLGVFAPGLIALALTNRNEGRAGTLALLSRILKWDVGWRWYLFALAYIPIVKLSVALLHRAVTGAWPRFGQTPWYVMVGAIAVSTWAQTGEEIGWRGYALPRLSEYFGLAPASIILGIIWATWHLPLFFFPAGDTLRQSFPLYLSQVTAVSVALAWLYWRTGGSLLLVMLFHAAINNTKDIVPSADPNAANPWALSPSLVGWLTVGFLWIAAAYFLFRMRKVKTLKVSS
jgi:membrane protease YdiL (CAAX protease family)